MLDSEPQNSSNIFGLDNYGRDYANNYWEQQVTKMKKEIEKAINEKKMATIIEILEHFKFMEEFSNREKANSKESYSQTYSQACADTWQHARNFIENETGIKLDEKILDETA